LWHQKFVTADVTALFVMVFSDEDKILIKSLWDTQQRGWQTNFLRKAGQSMMLISCWKSCGTQAQLTGGQAEADLAVSATVPLYA